MAVMNMKPMRIAGPLGVAALSRSQADEPIRNRGRAAEG